MSRRRPDPGDTCGIAQAVGVLGDPWSLLVLRDIAGGRTRFDQLVKETGISRKVLTERLESLVADGVLERRAYHQHPPRFEYVLTARGRGALPVLAALQDFGDAWILGDGRPSATAAIDAAEVRRVDALVGERVPHLVSLDPVTAAGLTVVYCYPGTGFPGADEVPAGVGCTLESCTYRDRLGDFEAHGATVVGVSTQRPSEQAEFARLNGIRFPLLSDAALELTAALRLPTFRAGGTTRLKRLTLVVDHDRVVRGTLFPIPDVTGSVEDALALVRGLAPSA
ncbi:HxlR family transcriptional regulator [Intrasporangium oryzae NRRL B-24470]|uniref:HxlR family transcriptional regulator n=1 Tax=Intrasporangium oryzae NRRL B-24470 TaxID=1386089 RepID=W9G285_9MICO|nr:winged helix-turn-helix transcriptional regulator [Intrasporangium oryzae]EWT00226.1 HxlR family transcriptional regulator [Intrasporangium oryzae NRRL B-24470]